MCYNYEIDDKQLGMEFPDLTGTLYEPLNAITILSTVLLLSGKPL